MAKDDFDTRREANLALIEANSKKLNDAHNAHMREAWDYMRNRPDKYKIPDKYKDGFKTKAELNNISKSGPKKTPAQLNKLTSMVSSDHVKQVDITNKNIKESVNVFTLNGPNSKKIGELSKDSNEYGKTLISKPGSLIDKYVGKTKSLFSNVNDRFSSTINSLRNGAKDLKAKYEKVRNYTKQASSVIRGIASKDPVTMINSLEKGTGFILGKDNNSALAATLRDSFDAAKYSAVTMGKIKYYYDTTNFQSVTGSLKFLEKVAGMKEIENTFGPEASSIAGAFKELSSSGVRGLYGDFIQLKSDVKYFNYMQGFARSSIDGSWKNTDYHILKGVNDILGPKATYQMYPNTIKNIGRWWDSSTPGSTLDKYSQFTLEFDRMDSEWWIYKTINGVPIIDLHKFSDTQYSFRKTIFIGSKDTIKENIETKSIEVINNPRESLKFLVFTRDDRNIRVEREFRKFYPSTVIVNSNIKKEQKPAITKLIPRGSLFADV